MEEEQQKFLKLRELMVERQLRGRGILDKQVLSAMGTVPREEFIPQGMRSHAYADGPLPIGNEQTISQPYVVAAMTEALGLLEGDRVLEIGTGSGYQTAVLAEAGFKVYTVERISMLLESARCSLKRLGYDSVEYRFGDGYSGWKEKAPFDGVLVTAAAPDLPDELIQQLAVGGRLVLPIGTCSQELRVYRKHDDGSLYERFLFPVRFVPMLHGET